MDSIIAEAIEQEKEDYLEYHERVTELHRKMCEVMAVTFQHDNMDYSADRIVLWLDSTFHPVAPFESRSRFQVVTLISLKGRLFTFVVYIAIGPRSGWIHIPETDISKPIRDLMNQIKSLLEGESYVYVTGDKLKESVPRTLTQLDRTEASVFNVLFGEMDL